MVDPVTDVVEPVTDVIEPVAETVGSHTGPVSETVDPVPGSVTEPVNDTLGSVTEPLADTRGTVSVRLDPVPPRVSFGSAAAGADSARAPPASSDRAAPLGSLQPTLRALSNLLGTGLSSSTLDRLLAAPAAAPGSAPAPAPAPSPGTGGGSSGGGVSPFGGSSSPGLLSLSDRVPRDSWARLMMGPADWQSAAIVALLERPG